MSDSDKSGVFATTRAWLELLSFVAVVVGIVIGFNEHFANVAQERRDLVETVYSAIDGEYRDYLGRLFEEPRLARHRRPQEARAPELTAEERTRLRVLDELSLDLFERAYLEYNDPDKIELMTDARRNQWGGWEDDIGHHLADPTYRAVWADIGHTFDRRFQDYVAQRVASLTP